MRGARPQEAVQHPLSYVFRAITAPNVENRCRRHHLECLCRPWYPPVEKVEAVPTGDLRPGRTTRRKHRRK